MSKELHINTFLAQAGIKSDKATWCLGDAHFIFQQLISIQSLASLLVLIIPVLKTQLAVRRRRSWRQSNQQIMP